MNQLERLNLRENRNCDALQIRFPYVLSSEIETLPLAFRSTDRDGRIVDVHEKTTMIEVPDPVYPPGWIPGQHSWHPRCLQHRWLSRKGAPYGRGAHYSCAKSARSLVT